MFIHGAFGGGPRSMDHSQLHAFVQEIANAEWVNLI